MEVWDWGTGAEVRQVVVVRVAMGALVAAQEATGLLVGKRAAREGAAGTSAAGVGGSTRSSPPHRWPTGRTLSREGQAAAATFPIHLASEVAAAEAAVARAVSQAGLVAIVEAALKVVMAMQVAKAMPAAQEAATAGTRQIQRRSRRTSPPRTRRRPRRNLIQLHQIRTTPRRSPIRSRPIPTHNRLTHLPPALRRPLGHHSVAQEVESLAVVLAERQAEEAMAVDAPAEVVKAAVAMAHKRAAGRLVEPAAVEEAAVSTEEPMAGGAE